MNGHPPGYGPTLRQVRGVTLLELVTTLGIASALLGVAVPSFFSILERTRTATVANLLLTDLARARNEAIATRVGAVVCPSADGATCLGDPDFSRGWIGFRDTDRNGAPGAGETVFTVAQSVDLRGRRVVTTRGRQLMRFRPDGRSGGTNLSIRICDAEGAPQRVVIVNVGGRARIRPSDASTVPCA